MSEIISKVRGNSFAKFLLIDLNIRFVRQVKTISNSRMIPVKCPCCDGKIRRYKEIPKGENNEFHCPYCEKIIKRQISWKRLAALLPLAFVFHFLILKPVVIYLGFSGAGISGISGVLAAMLSFNLVTAEVK